MDAVRIAPSRERIGSPDEAHEYSRMYRQQFEALEQLARRMGVDKKFDYRCTIGLATHPGGSHQRLDLIDIILALAKRVEALETARDGRQ